MIDPLFIIDFSVLIAFGFFAGAKIGQRARKSKPMPPVLLCPNCNTLSEFFHLIILDKDTILPTVKVVMGSKRTYCVNCKKMMSEETVPLPFKELVDVSQWQYIA